MSEVIEPVLEPVVPPTPPPVEPELQPLADKEADRYRVDMLKYKTENEKLKKEIDQKKIESLKTAKNWQELATLKEQEAADSKARLDSLQQALVDREKYSSLKTEALKSGINPVSLPDLELLDFPELQLETTSQGKIIVHGADRAIQNLKLLRPHWFQTKPPTINPNSPDVLTPSNGAPTVDSLQKLVDAYKKNPTTENERAYREAITKFKS